MRNVHWAKSLAKSDATHWHEKVFASLNAIRDRTFSLRKHGKKAISGTKRASVARTWTLAFDMATPVVIAGTNDQHLRDPK